MSGYKQTLCQGTVGKCECRRDMRWNSAEGECQIFLDVDCSRITYDTRPSTAGTMTPSPLTLTIPVLSSVLAAVDRANAALRVDETSAQVVPDIGERNTESQQIY